MKIFSSQINLNNIKKNDHNTNKANLILLKTKPNIDPTK
jgi:hypothetical protein